MSGLATMRAMIELGLSDEQKLVLLAAIEADAGPSRSSSAERQRRYRERKRAGVTSDVTPLRIDRDVTEAPAPNKSPPDPQKLTPTPAHSGTQTRARKAGDFPCPEGVDPQHWSDFLANRKTKRLTNTPTAYRNLLGDLAKLADDEWPPGRIVEFAAARGWGAIFDPRNRDNSNGRSTSLGRHQPAAGVGPNVRAAQRVFGTG